MLRRAVVSAGLALLAWSTPALAADITIGPDGRTAAVFDYEQAVRERLFIPQPGIDQDGVDGDDWIAVEVMRPQETQTGLKSPVIVDPSPYYTTQCRGNESECIGDPDGDGRNDKWPLFYDNFFVPRGYAYVLAQMNGTGNSTGCPLHGGSGDIAGMKSVIDWLAGRIPAYPAKSLASPTYATWSNGSAAMIGKSYDGTLANGVAATGVAGLKTIVPISAISDWYRYSRQNGVVYSGWNNHYAASLSSTVTNADRRTTPCAPSRTAMSAADGDATGDMNPFWDDRNYLTGVGNVTASVFAVHGFQDDNVKLDHLGPWWDGLKANGVPRKLWLLRAGHVDPFDSRRAVWVDTLHRWFDHWLLGVDNGIMAEPQVTVEESKDVWQDYGDWPLPGSSPVPVYLRGTAPDAAGGLGLSSGGALDSVTWLDQGAQNETAIINDPMGAQVRRRVFLSAPLAQDLRLSRTPVVDISAALDKPQSNLGAVLVDYGPGDQITRSGEGISTTTATDCWGASTTRQFPPGTVIDHGACYRIVSKPTIAVTQWRITRGILDSANRNSLTAVEPVTPSTQTRFSWPLIPDEHLIPAGHQLGIVLVANYSGVGVSGTAGTTFTLDTKVSKVMLPVVGGYRALAGTRAFSPETTPPVMAGVPDDIVVEVPDATGTVVNYPLPTATDDETPDPHVACDPPSGSRFPVGATQVTCTATDAYDNTTIRAFTVTVVDSTPDSTPPVLSGVPADLVVGAQDAGGATLSYALPTATDNKTAAPLVVCDPAPGSKLPVGKHTITCTATDDDANKAEATFSVTVTPPPDTTPPVLTGMPTDIVVDAEGASGAIVTYTPPTATDDTTAHPGVSCDPAPGTRLAVGAHTVKCTATDGSGNTTTHAFTVTVVGKGSPPPVKDPPPPPSPTLDGRAPVLSKLGVTSLRRGLRLRYTLSEDARLKVTVQRRGAKRAIVRTIAGRAGRRNVKLTLGKLREGRYTIRIVATDRSGNRTSKTLRYRRR